MNLLRCQPSRIQVFYHIKYRFGMKSQNMAKLLQLKNKFIRQVYWGESCLIIQRNRLLNNLQDRFANEAHAKLVPVNKNTPMNAASSQARPLAYSVFSDARPKDFQSKLHGLKPSFPFTVNRVDFNYNKEALLMAIDFVFRKCQVLCGELKGCLAMTAGKSAFG